MKLDFTYGVYNILQNFKKSVTWCQQDLFWIFK
jgi:hypothetical protein